VARENDILRVLDGDDDDGDQRASEKGIVSMMRLRTRVFIE
jgi:hypothetical protein